MHGRTPSEAAPGETVRVKVMLRPYRGAPVVREVPVTIPLQATRGTTLRALVSDADSLNRIPNLLAAQGRLGNLDQLITMLNRTRRNDRVYVTLLKPAPTLIVEDKEMPGAPLSQLNVLNQTLPADSALLRETSMGEWSLRLDQAVAGVGFGNNQGTISSQISADAIRLQPRPALCGPEDLSCPC